MNGFEIPAHPALPGRVRAAFAAALLALASATPAFSADKALPPLPQLPAAEPDLTGWYLRGDISYIMPRAPDVAAYGATTIRFDSERLGKAASLGLGVGYKVNGWLRGDVTLDQSTAMTFRGTTSQTGYVLGYSPDEAKVSFGTGLVNGYLDLGSWSGFTPYIGAGLGFSRVHVADYRSSTYLFPGAPGYVGTGDPYLAATGTIPGDTRTNFAWALMAGTSIEVTRTLSLDVGYRYLNLGRAQTSLDAFGVGARSKSLQVNEVRFGVRAMLPTGE